MDIQLRVRYYCTSVKRIKTKDNIAEGTAEGKTKVGGGTTLIVRRVAPIEVENGAIVQLPCPGIINADRVGP